MKVDKSGHVLSKMERYTLQLMADHPEEDYNGIARIAVKSPTTIKSQTVSVYKKLGVKTRLAAVLEGWYLGEITLLNTPYSVKEI